MPCQQGTPPQKLEQKGNPPDSLASVVGIRLQATPWCRSGVWREGSHASDTLLTFGLPRAILEQALSRDARKSSHRQRRGAAVVFGAKDVTLLTFGLPCAILEQAHTRGSSHRQHRGAQCSILIQAHMRNGFHRRRRGAAVVFSAKEVTLLTFGLPMRSRTREISDRRRRGVAVVLGHAFDI